MTGGLAGCFSTSIGRITEARRCNRLAGWISVSDTNAPRRRSRLRQVALDTRPLSVPAFRRTFAGQGASYIGTMVTEVAVPVQIYADSHSSLFVGLAGLAGLVPITIFGLYGGAVAITLCGLAGGRVADAVARRWL